MTDEPPPNQTEKGKRKGFVGKGPNLKKLFRLTPEEKHELECLWNWQELSAKSPMILGQPSRPQTYWFCVIYFYARNNPKHDRI